jgi:hypothetical protein
VHFFLGSHILCLTSSSIASENLRSGLVSPFLSGIADELETMDQKVGSSRSRVPEEVWATTWSKLDLQNRFIVTRVCRAWRSTALAIPGLWSLIRFSSNLHADSCMCGDCQYPSGDSSYTLDRETELDKLHEQLSRTRAQPLALEVYFVPWQDYENENKRERFRFDAPLSDFGSLDSFVEFMEPYRDRLCSVAVASTSTTAYPLQKLLEGLGVLPHVTSLTFEFANLGDDAPESHPSVCADWLRFAPALRSVTLRYSSMRLGVGPSPPGMESIQSVTMSIFTEEDDIQTCRPVSQPPFRRPEDRTRFLALATSKW